MTAFLEELSRRRRFGMKPGLDTIREVCRRLGDPQKTFRPIHVAGTNGKGAVCAMLDACLGGGRYTSPHLVSVNERFFLHGRPIEDTLLERAAEQVSAVAPDGMTFFEALTAVAFLVYSETQPCPVVLETGLGGRLDATNVCEPALCVITRIGLEHCDWLGSTLEKIAAEKAGIVKSGVPVVLGRNDLAVRRVVEACARNVGAPFFYAPELAYECELPPTFSLEGTFNRENGVTVLAALKLLKGTPGAALSPDEIGGLSGVVWPGRFQRIGSFLVDGAHNPPAARALAESLSAEGSSAGHGYDLIAGFCGDKAVEDVLRILSPFVRRAYAVQMRNPRSLTAADTAARMRAVGLDTTVANSLSSAIASIRSEAGRRALVCGSLFLAGEALVLLDAYPWGPASRIDQSELLKRI